MQPTLNKHRPYLQHLDQQSQLYVVGLIMENPTLYLAEICQHIHEVFALNVTLSTVCRLLRSYRITRKKIRCITLQRYDTLRGAFRAQCSNFSVDKFVWIDETGSDARSHARKYGYVLRGLTLVTHQLHTRGYVRVSPSSIRNPQLPYFFNATEIHCREVSLTSWVVHLTPIP